MQGHLPAVIEAREAIKGVVLETPLVKSHVMSDVLGFDTYLKLENLQITGAFKIRGCYNRIRKLPKDARGIVAASSGSHGIASSLAAKMLGVPATVVMPETSPMIKRKRVQGYGARLVIHGQSYDDAYELAHQMADETGQAFLPSFNDIDIIHGQGTIALEVMEQCPDMDFMAMPIGGGGLYAGVLAAMKEIKPAIPVWGVEAEGAASAAMSLSSGKLERLASISTIADAIAVKVPGEIPFEIIKRYADGIALVSDSDIMRATGELTLWAKVMAEPAAAAALAVDWTAKLGYAPKAAVFVVTGGNLAIGTLKKAIESCEEWPTKFSR